MFNKLIDKLAMETTKKTKEAIVKETKNTINNATKRIDKKVDETVKKIGVNRLLVVSIVVSALALIFSMFKKPVPVVVNVYR